MIGTYEITGILGHGGMGDVYSAVDTRLKREVAIKILPYELSSNSAWLKRFESEAQTASAINHPNIVTVYDIGLCDSMHYLVMELVHGRTLREVLSAGPLPAKRLLDFASQIAEGLAVVHCGGITHRDLKPENIMITNDDSVKILDFGLAVDESSGLEASGSASPHSRLRQIEGTLGYMSPEQKDKQYVGFQSDQFSFGAILYEMSTGERAFAESIPGKMGSAVGNGAIRLMSAHSGLPGSLSRIIERCLSQSPSGRYACTRHIAHELQIVCNSTVGPSSSNIPLEYAFDSIAVLSFANETGTPDLDYLCSGLAEEILEGLRTVPGLHVTPRSSAFSFRDLEKDFQAIAGKLGVRLVLDGTLGETPIGFLLKVRLIEASDGYEFWAGRYEFCASDTAAIQEQIVTSVAQRTRVAREKTTAMLQLKHPILMPAANTLYLRARFYIRMQTSKGLSIAIKCLEEAMRLEPHSSRLHAALAECHLVRGNLLSDLPHNCYPGAKEHALHALDLDPNDAGAIATLLGAAVYYDWDFGLADGYLDRMRGLRPCDQHFILGALRASMSLVARGRFDEAILMIGQALQIDPFSLGLRVAKGFMLYLADRLPEAVNQLLAALDLDERSTQSHVWLSAAFSAQGCVAEALAKSEIAISFDRDSPLVLANHARILSLSGDRIGALAVLDSLREMQIDVYVPSYQTAAVYVALGQHHEAMHYLQKALEERSVSLLFLPFDPAFKQLRQDNRFQVFLSSLPIPKTAVQ
jgi:serine/threonine protein kinase/tetratricopeptide (TPR) repeat protein